MYLCSYTSASCTKSFAGASATATVSRFPINVISSSSWIHGSLSILDAHAIDTMPYCADLICGDEQLTYTQLEEKANRFGHYLIGQGVNKDDKKVVLYCRSSIEIVIAMFGIVKGEHSSQR